MWSARPEKSKFVRLGRRPRDSRLVTEKNLVAEYRVMSELAAMKKCLPAFVTIEFPSEFLDWRRFDVVIRLVGEITRSEYYGGRGVSRGASAGGVRDASLSSEHQ